MPSLYATEDRKFSDSGHNNDDERYDGAIDIEEASFGRTKAVRSSEPAVPLTQLGRPAHHLGIFSQ